MQKLKSATPYYIGPGLLEHSKLTEYCRRLGTRAVLISDQNVHPLYATKIIQNFKHAGLPLHTLTLPPGEQHKSRQSKAYIEDRMHQLGCGRDTCLLALGGGVITDLVGFTAATFCRGIPVIYLPTTLLAMTDACIGGKTGINTTLGKNLIGSFTPPKAIFADLNTLDSLDTPTYCTGLTESVKHALITHADYFDFIQKHSAAILARDHSTLQDLIATSCEIKATIVASDPTEQHRRCILNFGHTLGHAMETVSQYHIHHGSAVAIGMLAATLLSIELAACPLDDYKKLHTLCHTLGLYAPADLDLLNHPNLLNVIQLDKKARRGQPRFVLLQKIGAIYQPDETYTHTVPLKLLKSALDQLSPTQCTQPC